MTKIPAGAPTVFIIDDDDGVRASISGLLKSVGLRPESFASAQEFLKYKRPDGPSCLVLDVRLPGTSGLDFQRELREAGMQIMFFHFYACFSILGGLALQICFRS